MKRLLKAEVLAALAGGGLIIYLLFLKPFVGVADNGDFLRMMNTIGLNYYEAVEGYADRFFSFSHSRFSYDNLFRGFILRRKFCLCWCQGSFPAFSTAAISIFACWVPFMPSCCWQPPG